MKAEDMENVRDRADCEGFDYAFRHYSAFEEVEDEEFHKLRKAYVKAAEELASYIGFDG